MTDQHGHVRLRSPRRENAFEEVPAEILGHLARLQSTPMTVMGLAAGDLIEARSDGTYELVERGGMVAVQVFLETPEGSGDEVEWLERESRPIDGTVDSIRRHSFALNVSATVGHSAITKLMTRFLQRFPGAFYNYSNVFDEDTNEPLAWAARFLET